MRPGVCGVLPSLPASFERGAHRPGGTSQAFEALGKTRLPAVTGRGYAGFLGLTWVRAAPARTIAAPTGVDQVRVSPRRAIPAAAAITGTK